MIDLMTGLTIPDSWVDLLKQLQKDDPTAVLAGGAIRDLYCARRPVKDLDFFIKAGEGFSQFRPQPSQSDYKGMEFVKAILWYPSAIPLPCNVICGDGYNSTLQLLESFDYGLCQIAFDGLNIIRTHAFDWDYKHAVMTLRLTERHQGRRDYSLARFASWKASGKYDDFELVEVPTPTE